MSEAIPNFFVYGEPDRLIDIGFVHVETVMARRGLHQGRVRAHKHERMGQITFWTAGGGRYFLEDRILDFSAPAISFVPSRVVHGFTVTPGSDAVVVSIADGLLSEIASLARLCLDAPAMLVAEGDAVRWRRIGRLMATVQEVHQEAAPGAESVISGLAAAVLSEMRSLSRDRRRPEGTTTLAARLRGLVERQFRKDWPVERYAVALGATPYLLGQACKKDFGVPVKELILQRRLLEAKRLLLFTVRPLDDIAVELGMNDPAYFSRFFHRQTGEAPSRWRRRQMLRRQDGRQPSQPAQP